MILNFFARLVGVKLALPAALASAFTLGLLVLSLVLILIPDDSGEEDQARQTTASAEAVSKSATEAIKAIEAQNELSDSVDDAVKNVSEVIENAEDPDAVRSAVVGGLCARPFFSDDPACQLRGADPSGH